MRSAPPARLGALNFGSSSSHHELGPRPEASGATGRNALWSWGRPSGPMCRSGSLRRGGWCGRGHCAFDTGDLNVEFGPPSLGHPRVEGRPAAALEQGIGDILVAVGAQDADDGVEAGICSGQVLGAGAGSDKRQSNPVPGITARPGLLSLYWEYTSRRLDVLSVVGEGLSAGGSARAVGWRGS